MRLIDADALIDELTQRCCKNCIKRMGIKNGKQRMIYEIGDAPCRACEVDDIKAELDDAPTIEAEPVRHGHWEKIGTIENTWVVHKCSYCGYQTIDNGQYCTNCGAKMDEVEE